MKSHFKIFPLFLSIVIIIVSFFQFSFTSFAIDREGDKIVIHDFHDLLELGTDVMFFAYSQCKSIYDGNFTQYISNDETFKNLWTEDNVIVDESTQTITFSDDLTAYMKQALIEYAEETNGFKIMATTDIHTMSGTMFRSSYVYNSFKNLVAESGCIAVKNILTSRADDTFYIARPFHLENSISLVDYRGTSSSTRCDNVYGFDTYSWKEISYPYYKFSTRYTDSDGYVSYKTFKSYEEGKESITPLFRCVIGFKVGFGNLPSWDDYVLYSTDGRKIKVFNSLDALKNYVVGTRSVYFGSGFYEDPGEIQVSFDDLEKYIDGKYDSFFDDLKDLIGDNEDNLTEEDLEKLVDKILDKMDDIGGNNKPGDSTGDNSGILDGISDALEGITSTISGYLDAILMYLESILTDLDYIVMQYQDMTEEDAKTKTDSALNELKGTFSEVGDMMTKKFPFCIPWDLKQLFVTLNGGKDYSGEDAAMLLSDGDIEGYAAATPENPEFPTFSGYTGSGKLVDVIIYSSPSSRASPSSGENGIMMLSADDTGNGGITGNDTAGADAGVYRSESGAPVFHIPFVLNSIGLNSALVIDMSPFDGVSDISRTLFLLIFIYQLILLSIRITEFLEGFIG